MVPFREIREAAVFERAYERAALDPLKKHFAGRHKELLKAGIKQGGVREKYQCPVDPSGKCADLGPDRYGKADTGGCLNCD